MTQSSTSWSPYIYEKWISLLPSDMMQKIHEIGHIDQETSKFVFDPYDSQFDGFRTDFISIITQPPFVKWKLVNFRMLKLFGDKETMDLASTIATEIPQLQIVIFDPKDPAFSEYKLKFHEILQSPPTIEQQIEARIDHAEELGLPPLPANTPKDIKSFLKLSDVQLNVLNQRKEICMSCENKHRVNEVTVNCKLCGCPGISFISGNCPATPSKW